jgi:outer membrane lipoprotein-sorting protein
MKKVQKLRTFTRATLLITACLSITAANKVTAISAEFTQEKHMKILSRPLVSKGVFHFQAPESLRWEYRSPFRSIMLLHQGKTKRYIHVNQGFIEDTGAGLQSMQTILPQITQWLSGRFDENPAFTATLKAGQKIVLVPRKQSLAVMIQRIELVLAKRPGIIKSVMIYESQDSFTKLKFHNVILNEPIEDTVFRKI